jgi:hypothetical protein
MFCFLFWSFEIQSITDKGIGQLAGIRILHMEGCTPQTITDAGLIELAGVETLNMSGCAQESITDKLFRALVPAGLLHLDMSFCTQQVWQFAFLLCIDRDNFCVNVC